MDINKKLDDLISAVIFATKLDIGQIETRLGYAKGRFAQAKSKGQVTDRLLKNISNEFKKELSAIEAPVLNEEVAEYGHNGSTLSMKAIVNLTQSNKVLAESNKILAISHSDLVEMVKQSVHAEPGTQSDGLSMFSDLLEVIADVASGKRYKSKQEALAELNKYVAVAAQKKK